MMLKLMGTLALLSTSAVNHAPSSPSKPVTKQVLNKTSDTKTTVAKPTEQVQVAKADDKKAEPAKAEATDGGTPAPKKGGGKK